MSVLVMFLDVVKVEICNLLRVTGLECMYVHVLLARCPLCVEEKPSEDGVSVQAQLGWEHIVWQWCVIPNLAFVT
jgi:hypothetical protein